MRTLDELAQGHLKTGALSGMILSYTKTLDVKFTFAFCFCCFVSSKCFIKLNAQCKTRTNQTKTK